MRKLITLTLIILNAFFWSVLWMYPLLLFKLLTFNKFNTAVLTAFNWIGEQWNTCNYLIANTIYGINLNIHGLDNPEISLDKSYLIICNHQAFTDIFVLGSVLNHRVPFIRYFLKQELIWFPLFGLCWWGFDFPFVKRYTREQLRQNPELADKDLQRVLNICEKYKSFPTALLIFTEGHRRTKERTPKTEKSPYKYLLRPRGAGLAVARNVLQDELAGVIDITIVYPEDRSALDNLLSGNIRKIKVFIDFIPISEVPLEDNPNPKAIPKKMQRWLKKRWEIKDNIMARELENEAPEVAESSMIAEI